jgi:hypothetical protein
MITGTVFRVHSCAEEVNNLVKSAHVAENVDDTHHKPFASKLFLVIALTFHHEWLGELHVKLICALAHAEALAQHLAKLRSAADNRTGQVCDIKIVDLKFFQGLFVVRKDA